MVHGPRDMPISGALFNSLSLNDQDVVELRVANLADYVNHARRVEEGAGGALPPVSSTSVNHFRC